MAPAPKAVMVPAKAEAYKDGMMPLNKFIAMRVFVQEEMLLTGKIRKGYGQRKRNLEPGFKVTIKMNKGSWQAGGSHQEFRLHITE